MLSASLSRDPPRSQPSHPKDMNRRPLAASNAYASRASRDFAVGPHAITGLLLRNLTYVTMKKNPIIYQKPIFWRIPHPVIVVK